MNLHGNGELAWVGLAVVNVAAVAVWLATSIRVVIGTGRVSRVRPGRRRRPAGPQASPSTTNRTPEARLAEDVLRWRNRQAGATSG